MLNKTTLNAFPSTNLKEVLEDLNVSYLVFAGVSTNSASKLPPGTRSTTAIKSVMVEDASSAYNKEWQDNAIEMWRRFFGRAMRTQKVVVKWRRRWK